MLECTPCTQDLSGLLDGLDPSNYVRRVTLSKEELEKRKADIRKRHHGRDCIICFEKVCVCKPK